ncbi:MAG: pyridoxal-phosphate dependent enzyme [Bacteroidia bacterium]|nr:pyridoxal-phosphate dependent enzyme [Bacteroidia bacterium]
MENIFPTRQLIIESAARITPFIHRTPVLTCKSINSMTSAELFFKCENFQKIGAFKIRGATNAVQSLSEIEKRNGVATHSSGNHAQALALAARNSNTKAFIVMPENSSKVKMRAVRGYGGEIITCEATVESRKNTLDEVIKRTGSTLIHPYNDYRVIAGQATAAKELIEEIKNLDIIMTPVGGGGLLSGTALAANYFSPKSDVIAGEPVNADDAYRSLLNGKIMPASPHQTIADGLRTTLGDKTFDIINKYVKEIITVSEDEIIKAMRVVWERMKIIIEPSSAVSVAAILKNKGGDFKGKRVGIILTGGNVDFDIPLF